MTPGGSPGRQTAKNRSQDNIFRDRRPARIVWCAGRRFSGRFSRPGASASLWGRQGTLGPVPVHFGRDPRAETRHATVTYPDGVCACLFRSFL